ncbi:MAG: hypothetical protein AB7L09_02905 [Nitrospira sp.]
MYHFSGSKLQSLSTRVVPHDMIPLHIRDLIVAQMEDPCCGLPRCPNDSFFQYQVDTATEEGMTDFMRVFEEWLHSVGVGREETVLVHWSW